METAKQTNADQEEEDAFISFVYDDTKVVFVYNNKYIGFYISIK